MAVDERRRHPRYEVDVPVTVLAGGRSFPGHLLDICRDAAYVESEADCALDTPVSMTMELPGSGEGPFDVVGRVIRLAPGARAPHGMAVLFSGLTPSAATRIDFFIENQTELGR